jgi:Multiubiquitin
MPNEAATEDMKEHKFRIEIDRAHYMVTKPIMTGSELRAVPPSPIGPDRDLFAVIPGGQDRKIGDNEVVEIRDGERFFTAPAHINPGRLGKIR